MDICLEGNCHWVVIIRGWKEISCARVDEDITSHQSPHLPDNDRWIHLVDFVVTIPLPKYYLIAIDSPNSIMLSRLYFYFYSSIEQANGIYNLTGSYTDFVSFRTNFKQTNLNIDPFKNIYNNVFVEEILQNEFFVYAARWV